jgi:hypothetical protein
MALKRNQKNYYTGKVAHVGDFPETQSLSLLVVCKTRNGSPIKDKAVSFSISEEHPLAQDLFDGNITEIGLVATGFSEDPIKLTERGEIYAMVGLDKSSMMATLGGTVSLGEKETDEDEIKAKTGMAERARAWVQKVSPF